jgi:hypothetical protein
MILGNSKPRRWHALLGSEVRREAADACGAVLGVSVVLVMSILSASEGSFRLAAVLFGLATLLLLFAGRQVSHWRKLRHLVRNT